MPTATFTLTGDLEALVGTPVARSLYIETTTDVVDPTNNKTYERASQTTVSDTFSISGLPAYDPLNHPYSASGPQFGIRVTLGSRSWTFAPPAAGSTVDLADVVDISGTPLTPTQLAQVLAAVAAAEAARDEAVAAAASGGGGGGGGGLSVTDNGDGTLTLSGTSVVDNLDGTLTLT